VNLLLPGLAAAFLLTFARVGTLLMLMPGIGESFVSARVRLAFALLVSLVLFPMVRPLLPAGGGPASPALVTALIGEVAVGLTLGLAVRLVMAALQTAGNVVAAQLGLSYAMTVDPTMGGQQAAIGNLLALLGVTLVLATDLHHVALGAIADSYSLLPPAGGPAAADAAALTVKAAGQGFALAIQIAAPFIAFGILFNLGLGVLSRMMPQFQVFFLGAPAMILVGFLVLLAALGAMMAVFLDGLGGFLGEFRR
jgi:flagellar biosynthesis protein FliR